jgi:hypothetical protein
MGSFDYVKETIDQPRVSIIILNWNGLEGEG